MNKKETSLFRIWPGIVTAAILVILAVVLVICFDRASAETVQKTDLSTAGGKFISQQEAVLTTPIEDRIFEEDNRASAEELMAQFETDPSLIWKTLKDYDVLIMGDSRAQCFLIYDLMDEQHCLVMHSTTIYNIADNLEAVADRLPRVIVISYGINDAGLYHDYGVENYMKDFAGLIEELRQADPGVRIYVNSILPARATEYGRAPNWMVIPEWNAYIKNYCEEHGIGYIDVSDVVAAHEDLYIDDGAHFQEEFYPYWGAVMAATIASDLAVRP